MHASAKWPPLEWSGWRATALTLQLWCQIVGKVRLALSPWLNHSWHVTLYVSPRGLTTSTIMAAERAFTLEFDFTVHRLLFHSSDGREDSLPLQAQTVAAFHDALFALLGRNGIEVEIDGRPNEVPDPIPFAQDHTHATYDPASAHRFWRALLSIDEVLQHFRTGFVGKCSPVHFFWGSFDLAVSRFSGRAAPPHPGGVPFLSDAVTREAYSHEVSSAGFWPGGDAFPHAAFYSYAYPVPDGFAETPAEPASAYFEPSLGEFVLKYDDVARSADPSQTLLLFLQSTFRAAADLARWDQQLERPLGQFGIPPTPAQPTPAPENGDDRRPG